MTVMRRICLADFDDTLVSVDSFRIIMKKERWFLRPRLILAGVKLLLSKGATGKELKARSCFKRILLEYYSAMPEDRRDRYIEYIKSRLNYSLIKEISSARYDTVMIISASEEELIRSVIEGLFPDCIVIANSLPVSDDFRTCYGSEKVLRLMECLDDISEYDITLYTDSFSDQPLIDISSSAYMVDASCGSSTKIK
jgi:phosphoserine phosphatase